MGWTVAIATLAFLGVVTFLDEFDHVPAGEAARSAVVHIGAVFLLMCLSAPLYLLLLY